MRSIEPFENMLRGLHYVLRCLILFLLCMCVECFGVHTQYLCVCVCLCLCISVAVFVPFCVYVSLLLNVLNVHFFIRFSVHLFNFLISSLFFYFFDWFSHFLVCHHWFRTSIQIANTLVWQIRSYILICIQIIACI